MKKKIPGSLIFTRGEFRFLHKILLEKGSVCEEFKGIKEKGGFELTDKEKVFVKDMFRDYISEGNSLLY